MRMRTRLFSLLAALCVCGGLPVARPQSPPKLQASKIEVGDSAYESLLIKGFYKSEGGWRWTARSFSVLLSRPAGREAVYLAFKFAIPSELVNTAAGVTLTARVNGTELPSQHYAKPGWVQYVASVPEATFRPQPARVDLLLDRSFTSTGLPGQRGVMAVSIEFSHTDAAAFDREAETARAREGFQYLLAKRSIEVPAERQREMVKLFHSVPIWAHMFFQNVQIEKNPLDLWMMQQIIYEVQPDFIIETGTLAGGSALYWAHTLNGLGLERSRVLTVDIADMHRNAKDHPLWKKYVTFYLGSSTDPEIVGRISRLVKGRKTLIALDSDHSMAHVLKELKAYAPLASAGSYLVVEDTHIDGVPTAPDFGPGPMAAVRKFLEEGGNKDFEQDVLREAYIMTFNPGGWLKRRQPASRPSVSGSPGSSHAAP